jgi:uncharacterized protein YjaG (DUF416 family)
LAKTTDRVIRYDPEAVKNRLSQLPVWKQVAFALLCCERMFPNYLLFVRDSGWGNADALRAALDVAWSSLEHDRSPSNCRELIRACEEAIPDTEDFASDYTSAALDAAASAASLIEILERFDIQKVLEISQQAFDTVYMYADGSVEASAAETGHEVILMHPLVHTELGMQRDSLAFLTTADNERWATLPELRRRCRDTRDRSSFCRGSLSST